MKPGRVLLFVIAVVIIVWLVITYMPRDTSEHKDSSPATEVKGVDTIINEGIYQSYFSYAFKEPIFVRYTLYHGGGACSRKHFKFYNDTEISTASAEDYSHSGYDEGHLADAEDFAYDCDADEKTFRFYNCVPQTPHLNRGEWKHWETEIRRESQDDSLLIITGSIFSNTTIGEGVYVPSYCWKVSESLTSKMVMHVIICDNTADAHCDEISIDVLQNKLGYSLPLAR